MITFKARTATGEIINSALTPFQFPAGEAHIKREEQREIEPIEYAIIQPSKSSLHDDLFKLAMWNSTLFNEETQRVLIMPYAPGARADRGLPMGASVYADFIHSLGIDTTVIFDPHSPVITRELECDNWMHTVVLHASDILPQSLKASGYVYDAVIAPDKGATERATKVAEKLDIPVIVAEKTRDFETGKLSGFAIEKLDPSKKYLLVDDICDGGGTFMGLAAATNLPPANLDLYVSHGVFSGRAVEVLPSHFGRIFTTNSYAPIGSLNTRNTTEAFQRFDVIRPMLDTIKE